MYIFADLENVLWDKIMHKKYDSCFLYGISCIFNYKSCIVHVEIYLNNDIKNFKSNIIIALRHLWNTVKALQNYLSKIITKYLSNVFYFATKLIF